MKSIIQSPSEQSVVTTLVFPEKLHMMLNAVEKQGLTDIASWRGNNAFQVYNKEAFMHYIAPKFFQQSKYRSFQRMVNMWGFERVRNGSLRGAYTHEKFRRGQPKLCQNMKCRKIKSKEIKPTAKSSKAKTEIPGALVSLPSTPVTPPSSPQPEKGIFEDVDTELLDSISLKDDDDLLNFEGLTFHDVADCDDFLGSLFIH